MSTEESYIKAFEDAGVPEEHYRLSLCKMGLKVFLIHRRLKPEEQLVCEFLEVVPNKEPHYRYSPRHVVAVYMTQTTRRLGMAYTMDGEEHPVSIKGGKWTGLPAPFAESVVIETFDRRGQVCHSEPCVAFEQQLQKESI